MNKEVQKETEEGEGREGREGGGNDVLQITNTHFLFVFVN